VEKIEVKVIDAKPL